MKNLYVILRKDSNRITYDLLKQSTEKKGIALKTIYTEEFDFSKELVLNQNDGLYNICDDNVSQTIEKFLINDQVSTFYNNYLSGVNKVGDVDDLTSYLVHKKNKLPVIKSVLSLTTNKELLINYAHFLGGFPIIIKSLGGSHGVGVMKIDSRESLYSVADYLCQQNDSFILKQFIDYKEHARLIVLDNKVLSSIKYKRVKNDFRSNVGEKLVVSSKKFSKKIETIAIDSVTSLGYEFGGVDILIDKNEQPFIAEVNFPCYFPRVQESSGVDISGAMIDFLIKKSKDNVAK